MTSHTTWRTEAFNEWQRQIGGVKKTLLQVMGPFSHFLHLQISISKKVIEMASRAAIRCGDI